MSNRDRPNQQRRQPPRRPQSRPARTPLDPARRAAFDVLRAVSERDAYANLALPAVTPLSPPS
jgi:16S rRNA (cytosine967-C5)-methyltransferase